MRETGKNRAVLGAGGHTNRGVRKMNQRQSKKRGRMGENLRLNPHLRLCPKFDPDSIAQFPVADRDERGLRVVDNCAEEHIM